ncbi:hypothetical protein D3C87_720090 [compost metagenome]
MSKVLSQTLGELIKNAIVDKSLNQSAIARKMGVAKQTINQIERKKIFDLDFLVKLRDASGLDFTSHALPNDKKNYVNNDGYSEINEDEGKYGSNTVELSVTIKITSDEDDLLKLGEFLKTVKLEAASRGFKIV